MGGYSIYTAYYSIPTLAFLYSVNSVLLTLIVVMVLWPYTYIKTSLIIYFKYVHLLAELSEALCHTHTPSGVRELPEEVCFHSVRFSSGFCFLFVCFWFLLICFHFLEMSQHCHWLEQVVRGHTKTDLFVWYQTLTMFLAYLYTKG